MSGREEEIRKAPTPVDELLLEFKNTEQGKKMEQKIVIMHRKSAGGEKSEWERGRNKESTNACG